MNIQAIKRMDEFVRQLQIPGHPKCTSVLKISKPPPPREIWKKKDTPVKAKGTNSDHPWFGNINHIQNIQGSINNLLKNQQINKQSPVDSKKKIESVRKQKINDKVDKKSQNVNQSNIGKNKDRRDQKDVDKSKKLKSLKSKKGSDRGQNKTDSKPKEKDLVDLLT